MNLNSIRIHLEPYRIHQKRSTTINHAFASALAPSDVFDENRAKEAMEFLGQDPTDLKCVYCSRTAQTWDHLRGLVRDKKPSGLGHQIGNLVPSCKSCNSSKGNRSVEAFLEKKHPTNPDRQRAVAKLLSEYAAKFSSPFDYDQLKVQFPNELLDLEQIKGKILALMLEADKIVDKMRKERT